MTSEVSDSPLSLLANRPGTPEDAPALPGVYMVLNVKTGRCYFGESGNVKRRLKRHRYELRRGSHHNSPLQMDWDEHGESCFVFCTIECYAEDDPKCLRVGAQGQLIKAYRSGYAINSCPRTVSMESIARKAGFQTTGWANNLVISKA